MSGNIQCTNIRFNMDDERHRYAWQLLQERDKEKYSSYSQTVISALIVLLEEREENKSTEEIIREVLLPEICNAVEITAVNAIEKSLPMFMAGYMACIGSVAAPRTEILQAANEEETGSPNEHADADIDFAFLGLE